MEYKLVLDQKVIDEYAEYYFTQHPRARKKPIERPIQPSLNQIMTTPRIQMNALKQKWKDFGVWWVKSLGLNGLKLERFGMDVAIFMPTNRRFDLDNFGNCKLILDSFTESGLIVDDDSKHLVKLCITGGVDKENPRTEIVLRTEE